MTDGLNVNVIFACLLVVFTTSFPFGYNGSVLNQPFLFVRQFFNETYADRQHDGTWPSSMVVTVLWSTTNAVYIIGLVIGHFVASCLADKVGRKNTILIGQIFLAAGVVLSTCCTVFKSPEMLIVGRVLLGVLAGIGNVTTPIFLAEISTRQMRGAMCICHQLAINMGVLVASVVGLPQLLTTERSWIYLHLINVASLLVAVVCLPLIPETPRYMFLVVGNEEKARSSLVWYRRSQDVDPELSEMATEKEAQQCDRPFTCRDLFQKSLRRPVCIAVMMQVCRQLSGISATLTYSAHIFQVAGLGAGEVPLAVVGTSVVSVAANVVAMPLIDRVGRRRLLIVTMSVMIVDLAVLVAMMTIQSTLHDAAYGSIVCVCVFVMTSNVGVVPIAWVLGAELFEQRARPTAGWAAAMANSATLFLTVLAFEPVDDLIRQYIFVIFAAITFGFLVFVGVAVPETKNLTFREIAQRLMHRRTSVVA